LLRDNQLREKMGKESLRIAHKKSDVNIISKKLSALYDEILKN